MPKKSAVWPPDAAVGDVFAYHLQVIKGTTGKWREATDGEEGETITGTFTPTACEPREFSCDCEESDCANEGSLKKMSANSEYHLKQHLVKHHASSLLGRAVKKQKGPGRPRGTGGGSVQTSSLYIMFSPTRSLAKKIEEEGQDSPVVKNHVAGSSSASPVVTTQPAPVQANGGSGDVGGMSDGNSDNFDDMPDAAQKTPSTWLQDLVAVSSI
jgi:hypothetical protein